jgi:hypothetical protein
MSARFLLVAGVVLGGVGGVAPAAAAVKPVKYRNCALLRADFPHGVAQPKAQDLVRGTTKPVTTFVVNKKVYLLNTHLDRDRDGVACELR